MLDRTKKIPQLTPSQLAFSHECRIVGGFRHAKGGSLVRRN